MPRHSTSPGKRNVKAILSKALKSKSKVDKISALRVLEHPLQFVVRLALLSPEPRMFRLLARAAKQHSSMIDDTLVRYTMGKSQQQNCDPNNAVFVLRTLRRHSKARLLTKVVEVIDNKGYAAAFAFMKRDLCHRAERCTQHVCGNGGPAEP